ncbi:hypothetical protein SBRY_20568 [Actinacidiphila bryophytorum]|uniref:Uncharacterized protein n=1 Tax=Actinacidiphila bryophytorum TaxID=1436133 RepID=A0A9W4GYA8_9ACTN|nr:hypothetical protein SBRY_20568 [Actinacidiphila bryophytorum]
MPWRCFLPARPGGARSSPRPSKTLTLAGRRRRLTAPASAREGTPQGRGELRAQSPTHRDCERNRMWHPPGGAGNCATSHHRTGRCKLTARGRRPGARPPGWGSVVVVAL